MDLLVSYFHYSYSGMVFQPSQKQVIENIEPIINWIPGVDSITRDQGDVSCKGVDDGGGDDGGCDDGGGDDGGCDDGGGGDGDSDGGGCDYGESDGGDDGGCYYYLFIYLIPFTMIAMLKKTREEIHLNKTQKRGTKVQNTLQSEAQN